VFVAGLSPNSLNQSINFQGNNMNKTKLARAVALAITGGVLSLGNVAVASATTTTMYNLSTGLGLDNSTNTTDWMATIGTGVDGWANGATMGGAGAIGKVANQKWAGTGGDTVTPFGYAGAHLNWGVDFTGHSGNSAEISTFDSFARYGIYADVDAAQGAWSDAAYPTAVGWLHDTDTGLFRSDVSGTVTLNIQGVLNTGTNYGFTIFKGMDTVTIYGHHNAWNSGSNEVGLSEFSSPYRYSNGTLMAGANLTFADIVAYSVGGANPSNLNSISFDVLAGQVYTIFLGGYRDGSWGATDDGYRLTISQVPVPAAVWLFGSGLLGLIGASRRKNTLS